MSAAFCSYPSSPPECVPLNFLRTLLATMPLPPSTAPCPNVTSAVSIQLCTRAVSASSIDLYLVMPNPASLRNCIVVVSSSPVKSLTKYSATSEAIFPAGTPLATSLIPCTSLGNPSLSPSTSAPPLTAPYAVAAATPKSLLRPSSYPCKNDCPYIVAYAAILPADTPVTIAGTLCNIEEPIFEARFKPSCSLNVSCTA